MRSIISQHPIKLLLGVGTALECGGPTRGHISSFPRRYHVTMVPHLTVEFCGQLLCLCCDYVWLELMSVSYSSHLLEMLIITTSKPHIYLIKECSYDLFCLRHSCFLFIFNLNLLSLSKLKESVLTLIH